MEIVKSDFPPLAVTRKRHPSDFVRIGLGVLAFAITGALAYGGNVSRPEEYLFRFFDSLPSSAYPLIWPIMQAGTYGFVWIAAAVAALRKHFRLAFKIVLSGTAAYLLALLVKALVHRHRPGFLFKGIIDRAHATGILGFPSGHAAVAATLATVISPYVSKRWRRVMWTVAWIVAAARVYSGAHLPLDVFAGLSIGWTVGSAFNLIFGTPLRPIPVDAITRKLHAAGIAVAKLELAQVDARGSTPLLITTRDGGRFFGKLIDSENRDADLLYRLWHRLILKQNEGEPLYISAVQMIEHEAYLHIRAAEAGTQVPVECLAVPITGTAALLVTEYIPGKTLDRCEGPLSSEFLATVWQQVRTMHDIGLAHRDLRAANVIIDRSDRPWLIDFSFSELVAGEQPLALDRTELMASLSLLAEPKEVVKAAVQVYGRKTVAGSLQYMHPPSLGSITRAQVSDHRHLLHNLREEIKKQTGQKEAATIEVRRLNYKSLTTLILIVLFMYVVANEHRHIAAYLSTLRSIGLWWMAGTLAASALTYLVSAIVVLGSTLYPLSYLRVLTLQFATSFVNRFTPFNLGQVVLTQRFLENSGLKRTEAVASTSLAYAAGIVTHVILLLVVVGLFTRYPLHLHHPKNGFIILLALLALLAVVLAAIPKVRPFIRIYAATGVQTLKQTITTPRNAIYLYGGTFAVSLFYALALYCSLRGFGIALAYDKVLLAYLAASIIAAGTPVPGGLGATEVALVAALVTFGVASTAAILAVVAYRLATYLLPTLPGFFGFRYLQKRSLLSF